MQRLEGSGPGRKRWASQTSWTGRWRPRGSACRASPRPACASSNETRQDRLPVCRNPPRRTGSFPGIAFPTAPAGLSPPRAQGWPLRTIPRQCGAPPPPDQLRSRKGRSLYRRSHERPATAGPSRPGASRRLRRSRCSPPPRRAAIPIPPTGPRRWPRSSLRRTVPGCPFQSSRG